ncbi:glycosyltransferase involved in cell wall biosynthesis [Methylohalomonas lacus]|uniref:Glycosyltransferase involved in cell wall biosynthesis n=1 Tax=Methylohalomonas lacus TaxID=398773 RepID=A0AAE3HN52_9GAMM|nr:glycosyltransferase [Methylohalomonas lacus]MCS3903568.1 glycosyltransferase involved in cell wall biosynthesis [Methylohalomonas lacus]
MRLLIDLQLSQTTINEGGKSELSLDLAQSLAEQSGTHEIWLLLNEALPDAAQKVRSRFSESVPGERIRTFDPPQPLNEVEPGNAWRVRAGELLREQYIININPDVIFVPSVFSGYRDDVVVSVGHLAYANRTAVFVQDSEDPVCANLTIEDAAERDYYYRRLQSLKNAGLILTASEEQRDLIIKTLSLSDERVVNLGAYCDYGLEDQKPLTHSDSWRAAYDRQVADPGSNLPQVSVEYAADKLLNSLEKHSESIVEQAASALVGSSQLPRLAYVSPLPPARTGIADYSAELLPELARYYGIELIMEQPEVSDPWLSANFVIRDVAWFEENAEHYDRILYHVGNSSFHWHMLDLLERFPGVVVLHDFYLGHLLAQDGLALEQALYDSHGYLALTDLYSSGVKATIWKYPANYQVLRNAQGVIVHSQFAIELARQWYGKQVAREWTKIPHLRAIPSPSFDRAEARRRLGIGENEFIVCSFGLLGPAKLNHRLLEGWLKSGVASDRFSQLVFVGATQGDEYCARLERAIQASSTSKRIRVTGFASHQEYRLWLAAADVAVQLRSNSRGETSGTILDCLITGLPLILNAHGSMAEVPDDVAVKLENEFDKQSLSAALDQLYEYPELRDRYSRTAQAYIHRVHAPEHVGRLFMESIERYANESSQVLDQCLISKVRHINVNAHPSTDDLERLSKAVPRACLAHHPQLLVDVSAIVREDLRTGVQRVTRAHLLELLASPPNGYRVEPVYLTDEGGVWHYRYARQYTLGLLGLNETHMHDEPAEARNGDIFHGLDLFGGGVVEASNAGLYAHWRARGVRICFTVYDLLPVLRPDWFPDGAACHHEYWLQTVAQEADAVACISRSVADKFLQWMQTEGITRKDEIVVKSAPLGADLAASVATKGLPSEAPRTLEQIRSRPAFVTVATIEPRKGYLQLLDAFEQLWSNGWDVNLVIVGQEGWRDLADSQRRTIPEIASRIRKHEERNRRLFWLAGISDEYLEQIYAASTCLIAASEGEGFGLPLIEAAQHRLPIIARDIPVFREVAGDYAYYFSDDNSPEELAKDVEKWLTLYETDNHPKSEGMPWLTWHESAGQLKKILIPDSSSEHLDERLSGTFQKSVKEDSGDLHF